MTRDELKEYLKLKLFYPQDVNDVMEAVDAYSSASNGAKPIVSGRSELSCPHEFVEMEYTAGQIALVCRICHAVDGQDSR